MKFIRFLGVLVVGLIASPVSAQSLGAEVEVATPIVGPTRDSQGVPQLVEDGDGHALLFADRTCVDGGTRVVRLDADGALREEVTTRISAQTFDTACASGECAGLVWEDDRTGAGGTRLRVVRFALDGTTRDSTDVIRARGIIDFTIASTSSGFALMYAVEDAGENWVGFRSLGASGLGSEVRLYTGVAYGVGLGCGASGCLAVWSDGIDVETLRVTDAGAARGAVVALATPPASLRSVAARAAGSGWAVALSAGVGPTTTTGWRVAADGSAGAAVDLGGFMRDEHSLTCDPSGACLVERYLSSSATVVDVWNASGLVAGGTLTITESSYQSVLRCAAAGHCVRVALEVRDLDLMRLTIVAGGLDAAGLDAVGSGADVQDGPIAIDDSLVVFQRQTGDRSTRVLVAARTDGRTAPTSEGHELGSAAWQLALAHGGDGHGLLTAAEETHFRVLDDGGVLSGEDTYLGTTPAYDVDLAWNGTHYLAAISYLSTPLSIRRFDAIGQAVDASATAVTMGGAVAVASDGDGFLLAAVTSTGLRGMRFRDDLTPLDGTGFLIRSHEITNVDVSFDGAQYVVAWDETTTTTGPSGLPSISHEIRAARVTTAGEVLDLGGRVIDRPEDNGGGLQIATAGSPSTWVAWSGTTSTNAAQGRVVAFSDGAAGTPLELFEAGEGRPLYEGLAIAGERPIIAYARQVSDPAFAPSRVRARVILDALGTTCTDGAGCASGVCSSGVCCDRACDDACEVCSAVGACAPRAAGFECRAPADTCDVAETCDGTSVECPAAVDAECDAGATSDGGGAADGGVSGVDAGGAGGGGGGGCSASTARGSSSSAVVSLLALALLLARRRRAVRR